MSKLAGLIAGNGGAIAGGVGVVAGVVGLGLYTSGIFAPPVIPEPVVQEMPVEPVTPPVVKEDTPRVAEQETQGGEDRSITTDVVAKGAPPPEIAPPEIAPPEGTPPETAPPSFDVVRIESDGSTLVAGQGQAGSSVEIRMDNAILATAKVDAAGRFVSFLDITPSDQPRVLTLLMSGGEVDGSMASSQTVILAPTLVAVAMMEPVQEPVQERVQEREPAPRPAVDTPVQPDMKSPTKPVDVAAAAPAIPETLLDADTKARPIEVAPAIEITKEAVPESVAVPEAETAPASISVAEIAVEPTSATPITPTTPTVLLVDGNGVRVLQAPQLSDAAPDVMSTVALDMITYSPDGEVQIAGRSGKDGFVRVYLDNRPITTSRIELDGNWRMELPDVDTGIYTLRVDEIDTAGVVTSRVETPFKREEPAVVAAAQAPVVSGADQAAADQSNAVQSVRVITVQPGSTLWAIARDTYGDGNQYVRVFQANQDRIRDADLIYPGQVFNVPSDVKTQ